jgi:hypothetical protein
MSYQPPPQQPYPPAQQPPAYGPPPQQPSYGPPPQQQPYGMEPPEATLIKSMLNIASILALIFGILFLLLAIWQFWAYFAWVSPVYDPYGVLAGARTGYIIVAIVVVIFAIMNFIIFMQCKKISGMVDQRQYAQAKSKTLIWVIIGFIFGGFITAILLIIAYLKYDNLIRWSQPGQYPPAQQPYYQPQPQYPPPQYPQAQQPPQQPPQSYP